MLPNFFAIESGSKQTFIEDLYFTCIEGDCSSNKKLKDFDSIHEKQNR